MKVFLSWSGDTSLRVATAFRDWLPSVLQSVTPYVSAEDLDKGSRWSTDIAKELELSTYGVLCITKSNIDAPWINFEAGALSKTVDKARVSPFLFNLKRSEVKGPLLQFQSTVNEKDDIAKLLTSINGSCPEAERLDATRLQRVFEVWWPELAQTLKAIPLETAATTTRKPEERTSDVGTSAILEELLDLARNQQKLLRSPPSLLPPDYIADVLREVLPMRVRQDREMSDAIDYLVRHFRDLEVASEHAATDSVQGERVVHELRALRGVIQYLEHRIEPPPPRPALRSRHAPPAEQP